MYLHTNTADFLSLRRRIQQALIRITVATFLVLFVCTIFAGSASAIQDISSKSDLEKLCKNGGEGRLTADIQEYYKVKKDVVLDLNGHTITPKYDNYDHVYATFRVVDGATFTLKDTKGGGYIGHRDSLNGGGVKVKKGSTFIMESGMIYDCKNAVEVEDGKFYMKGGIIKDCDGGAGGAVYVNEDGYFEMSGDARIENCHSRMYGAGVDVFGGKFLMKDNAIITGCYVRGTCEYSGEYDEYTNAYEQCGGGVCVRNGGKFTMEGNTKISNCYNRFPLYSGNEYMTIPDFYAGGGGVGVVSGGTFTMNGNATISGCYCEEKYRNFVGGGGVFVDGGTFKMNGGTITGCYIQNMLNTMDTEYYTADHCGRGGGVYQQSGTVELRNGTISNSEAYYGGGICTYTSRSIILENMTIDGCRAYDNNGYGYGGGMYLAAGTSTTIKDSRFINCWANAAGGAIVAGSMELDESSVASIDTTIENTTFTGNSCPKIGGAIAFCPIGGGTVQFKECDFIENTATYGGGAMVIGSSDWWVVPTKFSCILCNFTGNSADAGNGGAVVVCMSGVYAETAGFTDCTFNSNVAGNSSNAKSGGALYITNIYTGTTSYPTVIEHPEAPHFQIVIPPTSIVAFVEKLVVKVLNRGIEALYEASERPLDTPDDKKYQLDQTLTLSGCTFRNNLAYGDGGAIAGANWAQDGYANYMAATNYYLTGSSFTGNRALGGTGGAISVDQTTSYQGTSSIFVDLVGDTITGNSAKTNGGGVYLHPDYSSYATSNEHKILQITGNTLEGTVYQESNIYIPSGGTLQTKSGNDLTATSKLGVTTEIKPISKVDGVTFFTGTGEAVEVFYSDDADYAVTGEKRGNLYDALLICSDPVAVVSNTSGEQTTYNSLSDAIRAVQPNERITLLQAVEENVIVDTANPFTLDTAGFSLTPFNSEKPILTVNDGANFTITGNGVFTMQTSGGQASAISIAQGAKVTLQCITLSKSEGKSGGAINNAGTLVIDGATFTLNSASAGGAVYNTGILKILSGYFFSNSAPEGGAIYNLGTLQVFGGSFSGNSASKGGGIYHGGSVFNLSGNPKLSGNINAYGDMSNVYLADAENRPITCDNLTAVNIGISSQKQVPQNITVPSSQKYSGCFVSDNPLNWVESLKVAGTYIVCLNGNTGGSAYVTVSFDTLGVSTAPESQNISRGSLATEPVPAPTASGYIFNNWCTDMDGLDVYDFSNPVSNSLVLYANWTKTWLVNYDMNGIGTAPTGYPQMVTNGTVLTQPVEPVANGYVFDNWTSDYQGRTLYDFTSPVIADTVIYAQWLKNCTVTFNMAGHGVQEPAQVVTEGDCATRPSPDPSEVGYVFNEWYDDRGQLFNFTAPVTDNVIVNAKWDQNFYTVQFDTDGGTAVSSQMIGYGDLVSEPKNVGRDASILIGWKNGTNDWDFTVDRVYDNMTLTAQWKAVNDNYHVETASISNGSITASTGLVQNGSTVNVSVVAYEGAKITDLFVQDKTGSRLLDSSIGLSIKKDAYDTYWAASFTMPAEDVMVNATVLDMELNVTFDGAGGTGTPMNEVVDYGGYVSEPSAQYADHYLAGWVNGSTAWNFASDTVYGDMTLTAQWIANTSVQYNITSSSCENATMYRSTYTAPAGAMVNISIRADQGMAVNSLTVVKNSSKEEIVLEGKTQSPGNTVWTAYFTMPADDVVVKGSATPQIFLVTYDNNSGKVNLENATVSYGSRAPLPVASRSGYTLIGWYNGSTPWNFVNDRVYDDLTLTAHWAPISTTTYYTITPGTVSAINNLSAGVIYCPVKAAQVGETVNFSFSTFGLFEILDAPTVNTTAGSSVPVIEITNTTKFWNGSFTMPADDVIINATAVKTYLSVSPRVISGKGQGNFTVNVSQAKSGEWVRFTAEPYGGYEVWNNTIYINTNPRDITAGSLDYQVGTTNVIGALSFVLNAHTITRDTLEFGTRLIANKSVASPGESVKLVTVSGTKRNVSQFYYINADTNVRTNITDISTLSSAVNVYVGNFSMPNADVIVGVDLNLNLSQNEHLVVKDPMVQNGRILTLFYGTANVSHYFITVPSAGYAVKPESVKVTSKDSNVQIPVTQLNTNQFAFTMPNTDVIISASFYTTTDQPASSTSSGHHSGATVIMSETETPVPTPTAGPTPAVPPSAPAASSTTQPTQQSPAPLAGLIAGLGVATLVYSLRR